MKGCRALNNFEVKNLMTLKGVSPRDKAMFVLQLNTGMRIGEVLSLKLGDVCNKFGVVFGSFELKSKNTKTKHGGSLVINSTAKKALQKHCRILVAKGHRLNDALFPSRQGKFGSSVGRQRASQIYKILFELAGIVGGKLGTHCARKTFIGQIYSKTKDLLLCKTLLRHSSIATTCLYLESAMSQVRDAVMQLEF